jgi:hypothetical protein
MGQDRLDFFVHTRRAVSNGAGNRADQTCRKAATVFFAGRDVAVRTMSAAIQWTFSAHAIQRYRERTGCKRSDATIRERLACKLAQKKYIGSDKWYARGWVFAIVGSHVVTVMRPTEPYIHKRVWRAHQTA